jgi:hypothetical protein
MRCVARFHTTRFTAAATHHEGLPARCPFTRKEWLKKSKLSRWPVTIEIPVTQPKHDLHAAPKHCPQSHDPFATRQACLEKRRKHLRVHGMKQGEGERALRLAHVANTQLTGIFKFLKCVHGLSEESAAADYFRRFM